MNNITRKMMILFTCSILFAGCNMMNNNPTSQSNDDFLTMLPSDNSQNVGLDESIVLTFASAIDVNNFETNFSITSQKDIVDSLCPLKNHYGHCNMNQASNDTSMLNHFKYFHTMKGSFKWNENKTQCEFKSDNRFDPNTEYMIYMDSNIMNNMMRSMNSYNMMNGNQTKHCGNMKNGINSSYIVRRFKTINLSK
jgi:hypothetical protein